MDAPMTSNSLLEQSSESNMNPSGKSFPIKTKQKSVVASDTKTEFLCSHFSDRLFIIITQYNKMGTLVDVRPDVALEDAATTQPAYTSKVLLGVDEPLTHVVAKNLLSKLDTRKPVLLSMALKDQSPKTVRELSEILKTVV